MTGTPPPALPYRWNPLGARFHRGPLQVGQLIPFRHAVFRITEVRDRPDDESYPVTLVVLPVGSDNRNDELHLGIRKHASLEVYADEHYPICATCQEPLPCREQMAEKIAAASVQRMGRYEVAGVCPACREPVTQRQASYTFMVNLEVLGGPDVTFHLRRQCRWSAVEYERRLLQSYPEHLRHWTCPGHVTNHADGTYQCTEMLDCPGAQASHPSYQVCRCPDCHARGGFDCHPRADARRVT